MDEKEFDYLNVIPLVDVMLVLLTIVLTTSTFIATGGINVNVPKAPVRENSAVVHPEIIVISRQGEIWLGNRPVAPESLPRLLAPVSRNTPVIIRADRRISLQAFVKVYGILKTSGFKCLSLQTEQSP